MHCLVRCTDTVSASTVCASTVCASNNVLRSRTPSGIGEHQVFLPWDLLMLAAVVLCLGLCLVPQVLDMFFLLTRQVGPSGESAKSTMVHLRSFRRFIVQN